jgi:asparagine synthetase B (glutamine-hydrolysing)
LSTCDWEKVIFCSVDYCGVSKTISVFKATISGRPVYYHIDLEGGFYCSTHISLLRKVGIAIEENSKVLPEYFVYRFVMPPQTLYKNIKQLVAGSRLRVSLLSEKYEVVGVDQYEPPNPTEEDCTIASATTKTFAILNKSIRAMISCRDRITVLLSGGLDSSILCRMCQDVFGTKTSYSTAYPFEDPKLNREKEYALSAGKAFGMDHHYYESTNVNYLFAFLKAISAVEEPLHHLQSVMFYLLFEKGLHPNEDIVVIGEGADGIYGNDLHNLLFAGERFKFLSKCFLRRTLEYIFRITGKGRRLVESINAYSSARVIEASEVDNIIWSSGAYGSEDWVCNHFNVTQQDIIEGRYGVIKPFEKRSIYDKISLLAFLGEGAVTQSIWSKIAEDNRKIAYYPFVNTDLLDYTYFIPWIVKLRNPKNVLRGIARHLNIPEFIITRPKSPFGVRDTTWSTKGGILEPLVPLASKVFDEGQIRDMQSRDPKRAMIFWSILNYSIWKRLCINNEPLSKLTGELEQNIHRNTGLSK